jgi:predicted nucleic acid-binding protein
MKELASNPLRVYWDACAWIGLINSEPDKIHPLRSVWEDAEKGKYELWTSTYVYLELMKGTAAHGDPYPPEESDAVFELALEQPYVKRVQLDVQIGKLARKLKRDYHSDGLSKRADAIHLATALYYNLEEMHTWDRQDLLGFDGKINRRDGKPLAIKIPGPDYTSAPLFMGMQEEPK